MEDLAILESFRTGVGEKDAFDSLFRKYYPQMCVYAHRFVDMVETEDIVQECFVWIWNNRAVIVVDRSVPHYLFSMVRHRALVQHGQTQGTEHHQEEEHRTESH